MPAKPKKVCSCCKRPQVLDNFYHLKSVSEEHPDGYLDVCKTCATLNYRGGEPDSFMNILYALDIPWCPTDYRSIVAKHGKASNPNNPAILGRYIALMKLSHNKNYGFFDSPQAQAAKGDPSTFDSIENYDYKRPLTRATFAGAASSSSFSIDDVLPPDASKDERLLILNDGEVSNKDETTEEALSKVNNLSARLTKEELNYLLTK